MKILQKPLEKSLRKILKASVKKYLVVFLDWKSERKRLIYGGSIRGGFFWKCSRMNYWITLKKVIGIRVNHQLLHTLKILQLLHAPRFSYRMYNNWQVCKVCNNWYFTLHQVHTFLKKILKESLFESLVELFLERSVEAFPITF